MIVATGRTYLKDLVLSNITTSTKKIASLKLGVGLNITLPETTTLNRTDLGSAYALTLVSPTSIGLITAIPTNPESGDTYFATDEFKLYNYTTVWTAATGDFGVIYDLPGGIGAQVDILVNGVSSPSVMISELGLFLTDDSLFSRIVFEPTPFTNATKYKMTYTVYF